MMTALRRSTRQAVKRHLDTSHSTSSLHNNTSAAPTQPPPASSTSPLVPSPNSPLNLSDIHQPTTSTLVCIPRRPQQLSDCPVLLSLALPAATSLSGLVCSYGFYGLPPNLWIPCNADIHRMELVSDDAVEAYEHGEVDIEEGGSRSARGVVFERLGCVKYGCFVRALRFDDDEQDCIWIAVTQEEAAGRHQLVVRAIQPPLTTLTTTLSLPHDNTPSSFTFCLSATQLDRIRAQSIRMLQLHPPPPTDSNNNDPYNTFYTLMPLARQYGFARLFRSPTLFEDCVKTITLCNANWARITSMNDNMAKNVGSGTSYRLNVVLDCPPPAQSIANLAVVNGVKESAQSRRMRGGVVSLIREGEVLSGVRHEVIAGVFPSPQQLASTSNELLRSKCGVGYRSQRIIEMGRRFASEQLGETIEALLTPSTPTTTIYNFFLTLNGYGPFAAANATMLVGRLDTQPFDAETVRLMREFHGLDPRFRLSSAQMLERARTHYSASRYGTWQFLAYWFDYWQGEEQRIHREALGSDNERGFALVPFAPTAEKKHWQLVAQQTKRRMQDSSPSGSHRSRSVKQQGKNNSAVKRRRTQRA